MLRSDDRQEKDARVSAATKAMERAESDRGIIDRIQCIPRPQPIRDNRRLRPLVREQGTTRRQDPFSVVITFQADGNFTPIFQLVIDLITDRLVLAGIGTGADEEIIGKAGDFSQIEYHQI